MTPTPRDWLVTFTETTTRRATVTVPAVHPEWIDADAQAAYLLELARDTIDGTDDGAPILSSSARLDVAEPTRIAPDND